MSNEKLKLRKIDFDSEITIKFDFFFKFWKVKFFSSNGGELQVSVVPEYLNELWHIFNLKLKQFNVVKFSKGC